MSSKFSPEEATDKIKEIIANDGAIDCSWHCEFETMPKRGVTRIDIETMLLTCNVKREAEWDEKHAHWKYRAEECDIEGEELIAITVIIEEDFCVFIVTVF